MRQRYQEGVEHIPATSSLRIDLTQNEPPALGSTKQETNRLLQKRSLELLSLNVFREVLARKTANKDVKCSGYTSGTKRK